MTYYDKGEYLQTPQGQYGRYMWRKLRGQTHYSFNEEPKSKSSMRLSQKIEFQRKLLMMIRADKRRSYRSRIVAELSFSPTSQNPPFVHNAVKNYLDFFEKPKHKSIRTKGLVYQDDKQIAGLSVLYHLGNDESEIRARFVPFNNFLQDLDLTNEIISGHYSNYIHCHDFEEQISEIEGHRQDRYYDSLDSLHELIRDKENYLRIISEEAYNAMLLSHRMSAQEQLLSRFQLKISDLYLLYMPLIMEQKFGRKLSPSSRELDGIPGAISDSISKSPIRIQLPNVPLRDGDTEIFQEEVRSSLENFHQEHHIFRPLHIPVNLNVLYKPPMASEGFYKDLDNIMRIIVPAFNEIFDPPSTHISHVGLDGISDKGLLESLRKMQEIIPKSVRTSISGYDIFQMPRYPDDHSEGYLTASFSREISSISPPISTIDRIVEKWIECCED